MKYSYTGNYGKQGIGLFNHTQLTAHSIAMVYLSAFNDIGQLEFFRHTGEAQRSCPQIHIQPHGQGTSAANTVILF